MAFIDYIALLWSKEKDTYWNRQHEAVGNHKEDNEPFEVEMLCDVIDECSECISL